MLVIVFRIFIRLIEKDFWYLVAFS